MNEFEYDVFISYSNTDYGKAVLIYECLVSCGLQVWIDRGIQPGENIRHSIDNGLSVSRRLVQILSHSGIESVYCQMERDAILHDDPTNVCGRYIPILIDDCRRRLPPSIQTFRIVDFSAVDLTNCNDILSELAPILHESLPKGTQPNLAAPNITFKTVLNLFPKAFPFKGRARLIYTCRSVFEASSFYCSAELNTSRDQFVIDAHIPVDELETAALCMSWYKDNLFNLPENKIGSSLICSNAVSRLAIGDRGWIPKQDGKINDELIGNLILIGENIFSDFLSHVYCYYLPWRRVILKETSGLPGQPFADQTRFSVRLYRKVIHRNGGLRTIAANSIGDEYNWGVIEYFANPFSPDKRILVLMGCHRAGQYMLLSWLHSPDAQNLLEELINFEHKNNVYGIQVVLGGANIDKESNLAPRHWSTFTLRDDSFENSLPFFTQSLRSNFEGVAVGDDISDLSLLGVIPIKEAWVEEVIKSLPPTLKSLVVSDPIMKKGKVLHVTLFEFLHIAGYSQHTLLRRILNSENGMLEKLRELFGLTPSFHIVARQTRITEFSLQVLVDVFCNLEELEVYQREQRYSSSHALDIVSNCCTQAAEVLSEDVRDSFNINSIPHPLHVTLLRFPTETSSQLRKEANDWAKKHKGQVWGKMSGLYVALAGAKKFPFSSVSLSSVKICGE